MYSVQNVRSRFSADPVPNNAADHLVAVRYDATASAWQYNVGSGVNSGWRNFVPTSTDRLLGEMNSATQTATTFRGQSTVSSGINAGYAVGDLDIEAFRYNGVAAVASDSDGDGNYRITDRYLHSMATDAVLSMVSSAEATGASLNAPTTASLASADLLWTLTDHLGSVRDVVSAGGSIVRQHINYDAFGNRVGEVHRSSGGTLINVDSAAAVDALFGYAGREWDDAIDLQYNRARWYDPATGRFISQDPIGFEAGDANLYRYVGNSPTLFVDPSGLVETEPMEDLVDTIENHPDLTRAQKDWKIRELARGCVGITTATVGYTERGFPKFGRTFTNEKDAAAEYARLKAAGKDPVVFSVHFWNPNPLAINPDGTVDMGNSFDPRRTRPRYDTDGDGDVDADDAAPINFDFGVVRETKYGRRIVHADQYHNPDADGDGFGDYYRRKKIRSAKVFFSTLEEWKKSYSDFNQEVWVVVEGDTRRCESR
jgi:RHS repeat-associated protein